jgi:hypothetical protein
MSLLVAQTKGRFFRSGLSCLLLLWLAVVSALAADDPTEPQKLKIARARIEKLLVVRPLDLSALQVEYLVLFENFPRRQEGKEAIFELYHLLRLHDRTDEAYAALMKIQAVYQDADLMAFPLKTSQPVAMVATARLEEAYLYATKMNNPFRAIETVTTVLQRYNNRVVGTQAPDRSYLGRVELVARLHLAAYRQMADQSNLASNDLLLVARDWPGETVWQNGSEESAPVAAVKALTAVVAPMPASLPKKLRVLTTFEQSVIDRAALAWLLFAQAELHFADYRAWRNTGIFAQGAALLEKVLTRYRGVVLNDENGAEPAGVKALRLLRDAQAQTLGNPEQAGEMLERHFAEFAKERNDRVFAAYALLYLAELDLDFRDNAPSAYKHFMQVADRYGDVPQYPENSSEPRTLKERALRWAERAQKRM